MEGPGHQLHARTIVPDTFSVARVSADTVFYQSTEQLEVDITRSFYPGRTAFFISSTRSLDPANYELTPFYRHLDDEKSEWIVNESNIFNEANFRINPDGR
jgi:hypothetical protein